MFLRKKKKEIRKLKKNNTYARPGSRIREGRSASFIFILFFSVRLLIISIETGESLFLQIVFLKTMYKL